MVTRRPVTCHGVAPGARSTISAMAEQQRLNH
jgi:hypothetical protein